MKMDDKLEKMKTMEKNGGNFENGVKTVENWENGGKFKKIIKRSKNRRKSRKPRKNWG